MIFVYAVIIRKKSIPISKKSRSPIVSSESVSYYKTATKAWKACHGAYYKASRKIYNARYKGKDNRWKYHKIKSEISVWDQKITYYSTKKKAEFYWEETFTVLNISYLVVDKDLEEI